MSTPTRHAKRLPKSFGNHESITAATSVGSCHGSECNLNTPVELEELSERERERFWSRVDQSGDCWNWTAGKFTGGYGAFTIKRQARKAHRVAFHLTNGPIPPGLLIDHMCHNTSCVNPSHLRTASHKQNLENSRGSSKSRSGVRGVSWDSRVQKWKAQVRHNDILHHGGYHAALEDAAAAAAALRNQLYTHNNLDR